MGQRVKQISREQVQYWYRVVYGQLRQTDFKPDCIIGLGRGGFDFAVQLSHSYEKPLFPLMLQLRDNDHTFQNERSFDQLRLSLRGRKDVLIVDDIADSGDTIKALYRLLDDRVTHLRETRTVTAIADRKHLESGIVNYAGFVIDREVNNDWYVFPWEQPL